MCWKHSCKPFCDSLFGSSVAFFVMSVASQKRRRSVSIERTGKKPAGPRSREGCTSVVTLLFTTKYLAKTDRFAGELSCRRNKLLILHFSGRFLLIASLRRQDNVWDRKFPHAEIPVPATSGKFVNYYVL